MARSSAAEKFVTAAAKSDRAAGVQGLVNKYILPLPQQDIAALECYIREAQTNPPPTYEGKQKFVDNVNRLLDTYNLRLQLDDGTLARLTLKPGRSGSGYIQFNIPGGSQGNFDTAKIKIIAVPKNYRCNSAKPAPEHS